jgi:hypothetical protein
MIYSSFFVWKQLLEFGLLRFKKFIEKLRLQTNDTLCGLVGDALSTYFFKKNNNKGMRQAIRLVIEGMGFYVQEPRF